jgi:hypothetical protein
MLEYICSYFNSETRFLSEDFFIFGDSILRFWISSLFLAVANYFSSSVSSYLASLMFEASIFYILPLPSAVAEKLSSFISSDCFLISISFYIFSTALSYAFFNCYFSNYSSASFLHLILSYSTESKLFSKYFSLPFLISYLLLII